tara:strand:+ start:379 stop:1323 length:945 start_codon:yes stop_codon:yes gene_type:complete
MPNNRKELIKKLIKEGFTHRTLSLFSGPQLVVLGKKMLSEQDNKEKQKQAYQDLISAKTSELEALKAEIPEEKKPDEIEVDKDGEPVTKFEYPDGDEKTLLNSEDDAEISEDFASKAQQRYLYATNKKAADKLASKMTPEDYKNLPEKVTEEKIIEDWITSLIEANQPAEISKSQFIKTIKETQKNHDSIINKQKHAFNMVNEIANEMNPPMKVIVETINGDIKGYLKSKSKLVELLIKECGEVQLDDIVVGEEDLGEQAPLETPAPTIAPPTTKPGEKKRRGPFKVPNPNTQPKPKARDNKLPEWLTYDNLTN